MYYIADWKCPSHSTIVILNCHNSLAKSTKLLLFYTDISNTIYYTWLCMYLIIDYQCTSVIIIIRRRRRRRIFIHTRSTQILITAVYT